MSEKLLEVKNLKTTFHTEAGTINAVNGVSFDIKKGEVLGIVGESGSGKSVTALSITQLIPNPPGQIEAGEIIYQNQDLLKQDIKQMRHIRGKEIGMIFQEPMTSLNPVLRIDTQMNEVLMHHENCSKIEATERSIQMLHAVGIPNPKERIKDYPHQFSGGMRQRVMIAMALLCNPSLLIADEPTTALDVTIQAQILDLMMDLKSQRESSAILLITHDLAVVAETCDRVIVMYGGKVQEIAPIKECFKNPKHPYTKGLMKAMPSMSRKNQKRLKAIPGTVPSLLNIPKGCIFCSRFPKDCACGGTKEEQPLTQVNPGHWVRCHPSCL